MTESAEVKAHIKLRYVSASGIDSVTSRSMSLVKKKTKLEFKSLDGTMRTVNANGERASTNMKCSELDRCVSESLGVTPAILENVIFLHQEDSSWPMQDPQTLKKKLDDIFESTRYTKALEAFQKSKKEFAAKAKELKSDQSELAAHMSAADVFLKELSECQDNEDACREKLQMHGENLEKLESKATRFRENLTRLEGGREEINKLQLKIDDFSRRIRDRTQNLEKEYVEPDAQLVALLEDFDGKMKTKGLEKDELLRKIKAISTANSDLRQQADDLNIKRGVAESLEQHFSSQSVKLSDAVRKVCQKYSIQPPVIIEGKSYKARIAKEFIDEINKKISDTQFEVDRQAAQLKEQQIDQERVVGDLRAQLQRQEMEVENNGKEVNKLNQDIASRQNGLSLLAVSKDNLLTLERDYQEEKAQLDAIKATQQVKVEEFKRKLREAADTIRNLTDDYQRDADVLSSLSIRRSEMLQNEAAERQVGIDEEQILADLGVFFRNNGDSLENAVVPEGPDGLNAVLDRLERRSQDKRRDLDKKKKESDELIRKSATSETLLSELRKKESDEKVRGHPFREATREFRECRLAIKSLVENFELPQQQQCLDDLTSETCSVETAKNAALEMSVMMKKIDNNRLLENKFRRKFKKLRDDAHGALQAVGGAGVLDACPCCSQVVSNQTIQQKINSAIDSIAKIFGVLTNEDEQQMKDKLEQVSKSLSDLENPLREWNDSESKVKEIKLRIDELERGGTLQQHAAAANKNKDEIHQLESGISSCDKAYSTLQELKIRWVSIRSRKSDCSSKKHSFQSSQFGADTGGRSIEIIEQQQIDRMKQKEVLQAEKDRITKEETDFTKRFYVLNASTQEKEKALDEARKKGEKHSDERKVIDAMQKRLQEVQQSKRDIQSERDATTRELSSRQSDLTEKKNRYDDALQMGRTKMDEIRVARDQVSQLHESLMETTKKMTRNDLMNVIPRLESTTKTIEENTQLSAAHEANLKQLEKELMNQEHTKRIVRENLELRQLRRDLEDSKKTLAAMRESKQMDEGKFNELSRDLQRTEQERSKVSNEMSAEQGKLSIYEERLLEIQTKLNAPNYKDIKQKHRRKAIEYETTEMAVRDLESYHNALDKALQNFHTLKVREINKIIRELWQLIYKGQDIDMIKLEASGDEESGKTTRSYNYRVVMMKGDMPLDMRGRCSAGQRVLASIVIRLALAETFCLNCGILALDEPTTNLDEQNKSGLAHALSRIILSRSKQQSFQLVIITHDEDFVKIMSQELSQHTEFSLPEYYFRVSREESEEGSGKFFSHIERLTWQNL